MLTGMYRHMHTTRPQVTTGMGSSSASPSHFGMKSNGCTDQENEHKQGRREGTKSVASGWAGWPSHAALLLVIVLSGRVSVMLSQ